MACHSELQAFPFLSQWEKCFRRCWDPKQCYHFRVFKCLYDLNFRYFKKNFHKTNIVMAPWQRWNVLWHNERNKIYKGGADLVVECTASHSKGHRIKYLWYLLEIFGGGGGGALKNWATGAWLFAVMLIRLWGTANLSSSGLHLVGSAVKKWCWARVLRSPPSLWESCSGLGIHSVRCMGTLNGVAGLGLVEISTLLPSYPLSSCWFFLGFIHDRIGAGSSPSSGVLAMKC